jgi:hypothetical protein
VLEQKIVIDKICNHFAILHRAVELKGSLNFQDEKTASENFFRDLFNIIYDAKYENANSISVNFPAIDLFDQSTGKCVQVTYENTLAKIRKTKEKYIRHRLDKDYPYLMIFIFGKKPKDREDDAQVMYQECLVREIDSLTLDRQRNVLSYLEKHLTSLNEAKKSLELQTIKAVIQYLSDQPLSNLPASENLVDRPCPEKKLILRFKEYNEVIQEQYAELYALGYSPILDQAKSSYIDDGNSGKIKAFLRQKSRDVLFDNNEDGRQSLELLLQEIQSYLDIEVHTTALRFYILSELMECDIFPLSSSEKKILEIN